MFGQKFIEIHEYTRVTSDLVYSRNDIKRPKPDPVAFPSTRPFEDVLSMDKPKALGEGTDLEISDVSPAIFPGWKPIRWRFNSVERKLERR